MESLVHLGTHRNWKTRSAHPPRLLVRTQMLRWRKFVQWFWVRCRHGLGDGSEARSDPAVEQRGQNRKSEIPTFTTLHSG
ncbi:hypothetical protein SAMN05421740_101442 [Parapedobacter koreensis]|uniref:Uncharacterized protein n=2 Tax=Parapedobacter koreensis TaxID=332977 RepID=A0A1H7FS45_9SPHI|nr:hypothetical protein SAMN05421740_101442 [Parapedobacter koreensis]